MPNSFHEVENEFSRLRRNYLQGKISDREFKDRLKTLRLNDQDGRCWTIGARTGLWYYFDGRNWVEGKPPTLQEGKAICIFCGYENDLVNEACDYCGGNLEGGEYSCPKCGTPMKSPTQACPRCEGRTPTPSALRSATPGSGDSAGSGSIDGDAGERQPRPGADDATWEKFSRIDSAIREEEKALDDDGGPNFVIRALNPVSLLLLWGMWGLVLGLIFGVLIGTSALFQEAAARLPAFLQNLHGKLIGGVVFGTLGGVTGFAASALAGLLLSIPINLILSFIGGLKFRLDKL